MACKRAWTKNLFFLNGEKTDYTSIVSRMTQNHKVTSKQQIYEYIKFHRNTI